MNNCTCKKVSLNGSDGKPVKDSDGKIHLFCIPDLEKYKSIYGHYPFNYKPNENT